MKLNIKLLSILLLFTINCINSQCPYSQAVINTASATWYDSPNNGNCGYESLTGPLASGPASNMMIAALGTKMYLNGAQCGQCFQISNGKNSITVMGTDSCNDAGYCQRDYHFDLSQPAFTVLSPLSIGVLDNLSFIKVPCTVTGNVKVMMKDGSNPYWTSFLIFNSNVAIKGVSIKLANSASFVPLQRTTYNYWPSNMQPGAFQLQIQSINGDIITVSIPAVVSRQITESTGQFGTSSCLTSMSGTPSTTNSTIPTSTPTTTRPATSTPTATRPTTATPRMRKSKMLTEVEQTEQTEQVEEIANNSSKQLVTLNIIVLLLISFFI